MNQSLLKNVQPISTGIVLEPTLPLMSHLISYSANMNNLTTEKGRKMAFFPPVISQTMAQLGVAKTT